jgi:hypothetical protein
MKGEWKINKNKSRGEGVFMIEPTTMSGSDLFFKS